MDTRFVIFLCVVYGALAATDYRNQTVDCSFDKVNSCLRNITDLGGNFSAIYAERNAEVNQTCKQKGSFYNCMEAIPTQCNDKGANGKSAIISIISFVEKLCTSGSPEQNNFMNSSVCYNKNRSRRQYCTQNATKTTNDAKLLCCTSLEVQHCLRDDMRRVCPRNATGFQEHLVNTYSSYTNIMCAPYFQYCTGVVSNLLSFGCLLLTASLTLSNVIT